MDYTSLLLFLCFFWTLVHLLLTATAESRRNSGKPPLPPGPRRLPIVGNIFQLGREPHVALAELSKTYGPIMSLKLGGLTTIVISSPKASKEALQTHDRALSGRTVRDSIRVLDHDKYSLAWLPASPRWRNLRKIAAMQMFTPSRIDATKAIRTNKIRDLLNFVEENCDRGHGGIDIGRASFVTILNLISNTLFSTDFAHYHSDSFQEFHEIILGVFQVIVKPNLADFFPVLGYLDPQGVRKQSRVYVEKVFQIFEGIIGARIKKREAAAKSCNDVLDSLIDLTQEGSEFGMLDLKHMLLDLFVAGVDPSSNTVEWAMKELVYNPNKMAKVQAELRQVLGKNHIVEESDISKLTYLQAVIKETLRLHPPAPFLMPHKAESDTKISGYLVPKNAQILVNVWAIGRDPRVWENPWSFEPQRFLERDIDVKGSDFQLIPFGAGRRICLGLPLAHRVVHLMLASLVYSFDWKLEDITGLENVDMSHPLRIVPVKA